MKLKIKLLPVLFIFAISFSFKSSPAQIDPRNIIGKWNFVQMLDQKNKHIDTLKTSDGYMIPNEGNYNFRSDSTYSAQFTETNIDDGYWSYNGSDKAIILKLYWKKPYDEATQYIISLGFSTKDEKGDYYDLIAKKVTELTEKKLIIVDTVGHQIIYIKTN